MDRLKKSMKQLWSRCVKRKDDSQPKQRTKQLQGRSVPTAPQLPPVQANHTPIDLASKASAPQPPSTNDIAKPEVAAAGPPRARLEVQPQAEELGEPSPLNEEPNAEEQRTDSGAAAISDRDDAADGDEGSQAKENTPPHPPPKDGTAGSLRRKNAARMSVHVPSTVNQTATSTVDISPPPERLQESAPGHVEEPGAKQGGWVAADASPVRRSQPLTTSSPATRMTDEDTLVAPSPGGKISALEEPPPIRPLLAAPGMSATSGPLEDYPEGGDTHEG